jgi:hypothetical protein
VQERSIAETSSAGSVSANQPEPGSAAQEADAEAEVWCWPEWAHLTPAWQLQVVAHAGFSAPQQPAAGGMAAQQPATTESAGATSSNPGPSAALQAPAQIEVMVLDTSTHMLQSPPAQVQACHLPIKHGIVRQVGSDSAGVTNDGATCMLTSSPSLTPTPRDRAGG